MKIFQLVAAMHIANDMEVSPLMEIDSFVVKANTIEEAADGILPMAKSKPWLSLDSLYGVEIHSNILAHPQMKLISLQKKDAWERWVNEAGLTLLWSQPVPPGNGSCNEKRM